MIKIYYYIHLHFDRALNSFHYRAFEKDDGYSYDNDYPMLLLPNDSPENTGTTIWNLLPNDYVFTNISARILLYSCNQETRLVVSSEFHSDWKAAFFDS